MWTKERALAVFLASSAIPVIVLSVRIDAPRFERGSVSSQSVGSDQALNQSDPASLSLPKGGGLALLPRSKRGLQFPGAVSAPHRAGRPL